MMVHQRCSGLMPRAIAVVMLLIGSTSLIAQETRSTGTKSDTATRADEPVKPESPEIAAIRATAKTFAKAFNDEDAKALAELWTKNGEYIGSDGNSLIGPAMIQAAYAEFFKTHPGTTIELKIESIRLLGPNIAVEEGTSRLQFSDDESEPSLGRYHALHVRGDDGWRMASVREWTTDPATAITLKDLAWIVGEWKATNDDVSARVIYKWDDGKAFITGNYTLSRGDEVISRGTAMIANDPAGGLRSWRFDGSGGFSEASWRWDGRTWIIDGDGVFADGTEVSALIFLAPIDEHSFTWQATSRSLGGVALPGTRPIKVTRVISPAETPSAKK